MRQQTSDFHIVVREAIGSFSTDIFIMEKRFNGYAVLVGDTWKEYPESTAYGDTPTLRIPNHCVQALVEKLTQLGHSPRTDFTKGKLEATENHLQDLRKLLKLK